MAGSLARGAVRLLVLGAIATAGAANANGHVVIKPADLQWLPAPEALPPGSRVALLEGDPAKAGPFTLRLKLPAGYRIPPHRHPDDERVTVLSGTLLQGFGEKRDEKSLQALPAGSYFMMPKGMPHYVESRAEAVFQLSGTGPWQILYVDPKDDPRQQR